MRNIKAGLLYFALVFGAGFLLGAIRVTLLVPRLGMRTAELLEMPVMFVVIVLAARFVVKRFAPPPAARYAQLATGLVGLSLLITAELVLAVALQDRSLADYIASRDPVSGGVYLAMLVLYGLMPFIVERGRRRG